MTGWWTEVLLNFNFTDVCLSGNHSSCNAMFSNSPQWMTPFCPCVQLQNLQEKLNNLASKRSSSLIRSFSNVAIVAMFLQHQKASWKNIWNNFRNLLQKFNFRAGCLKLSSSAVSVLYYYVCCSPFRTSCRRQRASHTSLVWFRELEAVTNSTWQIFFVAPNRKIILQAPFVHWKSVKMWKFVHEKLIYKRLKTNIYF